MQLLYIAMGVVVAGWLLLALTSANAELHKKNAVRFSALAVWLLIVTTGWGVVAYLAYGTSGGLDGAWQWTLQQPVALRIMTWTLLLPYMGALGIWQLGWPEWQRTAGIMLIALATYALSLRRP